MPTEKSAGVILFRGSPRLFLLLHYPAGHWDFSKGNIEPGETAEAAALRELAEETGIKDARLVPGFREVIRYFYMLRGKRVSKTVIDFLASTSQEEVVLSFEHVGFAWLPYEEAMRQLTYENSQKALRKAAALLRTL